MDAIKFENNELKLVQLPIPSITDPRQVLIKVLFSGVCGTDLHIIAGKFPFNRARPLTLGHEFSGIVVDYGSSVQHLHRGDPDVVDPNSGCHKCTFCRSGNPHHCSSGGFHANLGVKNDGGWASHCLCSVEQVHRLPHGVSMKHAALAEPLSCLSHGWDLIHPLTVGQDILVMGAGIIGTLWTCLLHSQGHRRVTVADINASRLASLTKLETDFKLITPTKLKTERDSFDLVIDCTGHCPAIELGLSLLRAGGKICIFGVASPGGKIAVSPFDVYMKELQIFGVKVNPFSFAKATALVESLGDRYLDYDKLGVRIFQLGDFPEAIELLKNGTITKAMFQL